MAYFSMVLDQYQVYPWLLGQIKGIGLEDIPGIISSHVFGEDPIFPGLDFVLDNLYHIFVVAISGYPETKVFC